ncbi:MAG: tRNA (N6-isopentenyl adenosine(37)-C2)-methylthiotransferase MiaB [Puniceicoccales bacterium]|jgi:tRNA-2-methylthio-N6-dimethylallyladenosine synthase|nr:tRNA (N6-isopentenyl adenosine(37)-C2)-methylthiotransferase MiaB [Puniceicoccales bacterium]
MEKRAYRVRIHTFGCQMNERDSETMAAALIRHGHTIAEDAVADVFIFNTCSVRDAAERKAIGQIERAIAMRQGGRFPIVGVAGCMAQRLREQLFLRIHGLDFVLGTEQFHRIVEVLERIAMGETHVLCTDGNGDEKKTQVTERQWPCRRPSAFVNVCSGCPMRCSYCIVPQTRGRDRHRPMDDILTEVRQLAECGTKEVVLLGQIVNLYGIRHIPFDNGKSPFVQLLEKIHDINGIERIQFLSPHPCGFREDLLRCYAELPKLCQCVHLPIQSGSNRVLRAMNRGYTREKILHILRQLRAQNPLIALSTDLIVGFPGETDEDFALTEQLFDEIDFDMAFVFKFSPREGTPAAKFPNQIADVIAAERNQRLLRRLSVTSLRRHQAFLGSTQQVLVKEPLRKENNIFVGHSHFGKKVFFPAQPEDVGKIIPVQITRASTAALWGSPFGKC